MKRFLALIMGLSMLSLCACQKQALSSPQYPLDAETIEQELTAWGFDCTLEEDEFERNSERSSYSIFSAENGEIIGAVLSAERDGERVLYISFLPYFHTNVIPLQEGAIDFASRLFGSFNTENQVYGSFTKEYCVKNTELLEREIRDKSYTLVGVRESTWKSSVNGIDCKIVVQQPDLYEDQEYIQIIVFASDWDTFYSQKSKT